jgi:hypothetical protein
MWLMTAAEIAQRINYQESGEQRHEVKEWLEAIIAHQ